MKKLFPIVLALIGIAVGIGVGILLRPDFTAQMTDDAHVETEAGNTPEEDSGNSIKSMGSNEAKEYVKLNNQFIVSVVSQDVVTSLVLISLSLEVEPGRKETVFSHEPKLRDAFLQVMFDHANIGGFNGAFTNSNNLDVLRFSLLETAQKTLGPFVTDILILDIARQEV